MLRGLRTRLAPGRAAGPDWACERGAVSSEYGLLLVLVALAIVAAATAFGLAVTGLLSDGAAGVAGS